MLFPLLLLCRNSPFNSSLFALPKHAVQSINSKKGFCRTARCVYLKEFGGYDKLRVYMKDVPAPGPGQVLLGIKACGMNFSDLYDRLGQFREKGMPNFKPPFVMGKEAAGEVEIVGEGVDNFKVGDRVACLSNKVGLWTEYASVDASECIAIPNNMNYEDAAAFYVNYITAYCGVFIFGSLRPGEKIFIQTLAGGVGWAATQLARTVPNAMVLGTAAHWKFGAVRSNGVHFPIVSVRENGEKFDYMKELLETFPEGVDIILDNQSGAAFHSSRKMLNQMGRLVHLGANDTISGERKLTLPLIKLWWDLKDISVIDLVMSNHSVSGFNLDSLKAKNPSRFNEIIKELNALYTNRLIKPRIDSSWTFDEVSSATRHLTSRKNIGKVILRPS